MRVAVVEKHALTFHQKQVGIVYFFLEIFIVVPRERTVPFTPPRTRRSNLPRRQRSTLHRTRASSRQRSPPSNQVSSRPSNLASSRPNSQHTHQPSCVAPLSWKFLTRLASVVPTRGTTESTTSSRQPSTVTTGGLHATTFPSGILTQPTSRPRCTSPTPTRGGSLKHRTCSSNSLS